MKKNILFLINGFGIERNDSYNVYSAELMPNMDKLTKERIFTSIPNKYLDYKSAYRNFSMGINNPLTYSLIDNNLYTGDFKNNELYKYIINETLLNKSRLHILCFWDSEKTIEHLTAYVKEIQKNNISRIFLHLVLCQQSINDYKEIDKGLNSLNYDLGPNVKIAVVTGESNFHNLLNAKDLVKNLITEFGEKWKDLSKKVAVQEQTRTIPKDTRTFSVNPTYRFENNDQVLIFNYNNVDLTMFRNELFAQKFREVDLNSVKFYSLFPVKAEVQLPFMYNYAVSASYTLDTLKKINATCLVMDKSENCSYINYYLTGLRNTIDDSLKYLPTDDNFIYDPNRLIQTLGTYDKNIYIINYEISSCKTLEEMMERLSSIDKVIGYLDQYCRSNNIGLFITSLYGIEKEMYNKKQELLKINFSGRCPLLIDVDGINGSSYTVTEGTLYDLANSIYGQTNPEYKIGGLIKKKPALFSFLYKKPKEVKKDEKTNN